VLSCVFFLRWPQQHLRLPWHLQPMHNLPGIPPSGCLPLVPPMASFPAASRKVFPPETCLRQGHPHQRFIRNLAATTSPPWPRLIRLSEFWACLAITPTSSPLC